jgi:hypothetical protein
MKMGSCGAGPTLHYWRVKRKWRKRGEGDILPDSTSSEVSNPEKNSCCSASSAEQRRSGSKARSLDNKCTATSPAKKRRWPEIFWGKRQILKSQAAQLETSYNMTLFVGLAWIPLV